MAKKDKGSKKKKADKAAPPSDAVIQLPPTPPLEPDHVIHPRVAQRLAVGRDAREKVPRASLGDWTAPPNRFDPVDILEAQSSTRLQDLVPIRYGRMSVTPFTFLRGAAGIMAADLATQVRTPLDTQLCGDCHNLNFGVYGTPERSLVFDVNDFDETLRGPFEWDLKRLAVSFVVGARDVGMSDEVVRTAVSAVASTYRKVIAVAASKTTMDVWYAHIDEAGILKNMPTDAAKGYVKEVVASAMKRDSLQAVKKLTEMTENGPRIKYDPPLLLPETHERITEQIHGFLDDYRATLQDDRKHLLEQYEFVELARKVVGVGSVGTRCWIALMAGKDDTDTMFLQVKEADESVLARFGGLPRSKYRNHGRRVVEGQRLTQASSDIFLGWDKGADGVNYYVRQLRDMKASADLSTMDAQGIAIYGGVCAWALALGHARAGDRIAMDAYLGEDDEFDKALCSWAFSYADQNQADYETFTKAIKSGRIRAATGY